jgi:hypothetical protein
LLPLACARDNKLACAAGGSELMSMPRLPNVTVSLTIEV